MTSTRDLPFSREMFIIIKKFFKKFGQVNDVIYFGNNMNDVQNVVVSFKDSLLAMRLLGTTQKILYAEHEMIELDISKETNGKKGLEFVG